MQLVTLSEDFLATDGDVVRHLYVEDGDLKAQDKRAKTIEAWRPRPRRRSPRSSPSSRARPRRPRSPSSPPRYEKFAAAADKAIELSRQETVDAVEERDGSRTTYLEEVLPALEGLDVVHDELEDAIAGRRPSRPRRATPPPRASSAPC